MKNPNATHSYYQLKDSQRFLARIDFDVDQNGVYFIKHHIWTYNEEQIQVVIFHLPQEVERKLSEIVKEDVLRIEIELKPLERVRVSQEELIED